MDLLFSENAQLHFTTREYFIFQKCLLHMFFLHLYLRKTFQLYYFHGYWKRHLRSRGIAECLGRDKLYSKCMLDAGTTFSFHPCQFPHGYNDLSLLHDFLI